MFILLISLVWHTVRLLIMASISLDLASILVKLLLVSCFARQSGFKALSKSTQRDRNSCEQLNLCSLVVHVLLNLNRYTKSPQHIAYKHHRVVTMSSTWNSSDLTIRSSKEIVCLDISLLILTVCKYALEHQTLSPHSRLLVMMVDSKDL